MSKMAHGKFAEIPLPSFDLGRVAPDSVALFIGKRNTGKSVAMQYIAHHFRWIPRGIVCCPTDSTNPAWSEHMPRCFVYPEFNPTAVKRMMNDQIKLQRQLRREIWEKEKRKMGKWELPCAFVVLDDCGFDKRFRNDETVKELLLNGRHLNIFVMIALQYMMDVQPAMRTNADYIILTKEKSGVLREKIYKNWGSCVPSARTFNQIMDQATQNFGCLVIDNKNNSSSRVSDSFAILKANKEIADSPFKMGNREYWAYGYLRSIDEDELDNDEAMEENANLDHENEFGDYDDDEIERMEESIRNIGPKTQIKVRKF